MAPSSLELNDKLVLPGILVLTAIATMIIHTIRRPHYPPGPPSRFLWGNLFDFPKAKPYSKFLEWSKTYGDIVHLESFGQHILILNSQQAANDLLEKRSLHYPDRDSSPVMNATLWPSWSIGFSSYNDHWKEMRKVALPYMKEETAAQYHTTQMSRAAELLNNILTTPDKFERHTRTESAGTILSITYGYDIAPTNDPFVALADNAIRAFSTAAYYPGSDILNRIPFLPYLPSWMPFKKNLLKAQKLSLQMRDGPFPEVKKDMMDGKARDSIVNECISKIDADSDSEKQMDTIRDFASSWYIGGSDTTPSVVCTFILLMTLYPEVQKAAQAELDRVVGVDRLPDFDDRFNLPYLEAVLRETARCAIVAPLSIPHISNKDDQYKGYFIPKGTTVIANLWAMNNDEELYPNPSKFDPTRHLSPDGEFCGETKLADSTIFGHGRRKCPGRYLAEGTLWITISYLLSTMDIKPPESEGARKLDDLEYLEGLIYQLKPFDCKIAPRSEKARNLILGSLA